MYTHIPGGAHLQHDDDDEDDDAVCQNKLIQAQVPGNEDDFWAYGRRSRPKG